MGHDPALDALVDEAMKKSALVWIEEDEPPLQRAFWHVWVGGRCYLLTGLDEQPDPGFDESEPVTVIVRSKDNVQRLLGFRARVTRVSPLDPDWEPAATELAASRLNLHDAEHAPERWATELGRVVYRLTPTGEVLERPGSYSADSHRARPVPTAATTSGRLPWVLHRRGGSGRDLSTPS